MGDFKELCDRSNSGNGNSSIPRNLFERILMNTNKVSSSKTNIKSEGDDSDQCHTAAEGKYTVMNDEGQSVKAEFVALVDTILCCKANVTERIMKLKYLTERCSEDASILEFAMCPRMLKYCESLLISYCDPSSKLNEDLLMLTPLLSLFVRCAGCVETSEMDVLFVRNSNFLYQLMRACVMCVAGSLSLSQELTRITLKKKLAGRVRKAGKDGTMARLIRCLGMQSGPNKGQITTNISLPLESYVITLYDTSESLVEKNINEHIAGMNLSTLSGCELNSDNISDRPGSKERSEETWSDVVISHVFPFEGFVAYLKGDWEHWLKLINGELSEFLRSSDIRNPKNEDSEIKIGSVVGFWCTDVTFKWKPLMMVQCLRGIIIGKALNDCPGEEENVSWAIWAIDAGSLVVGKKVWVLKDNLTSIPPLVSLCSLNFEGKGVNGGESKFVLVSLKLLSKLLSTNPSAGWHMMTFGPRKLIDGIDGTFDDCKTCDGGFILKLIEHPDIEIRLESLKLILSLARSTLEVVRYLIECRFDLAVYSRLEICVHFSASISSDNVLWAEIRFLIMVLSAMAEGSESDMTELPGHHNVKKVLTMLTQIDNHPYVRYMAAKCLGSFDSHKIARTRTGVSKGHGQHNFSKNQQINRSHLFREKPLTQTMTDQKSDQQSDETSKGGDLLLDIGTDDSNGAEPELRKPLLSVIEAGDESSDDEDIDLPSVNATANLTRDMDHYTRGYKVHICNDMTHELSTEKNVRQVSENRLCQIVCGFLNNGVGGSVYFGINSKSLIEGLKLSHCERDNFRKGVDRMMTRSIYPEVRPACYDVRYVPVICPGDTYKGLPFHRDWVIEIHIKALPHAIYTVTANRKIYIRQGSNCVESMSIGLRQEAAEQTKKEIIEAMEEIKGKIPESREKLFKFVRNYLDNTKCKSPSTP